MGCRLRSVPVEVAWLSTTLCELDLSRNDRPQIDGVAVATILRCSKLRTLGLYKSDVDNWKDAFDDTVWCHIEDRIALEGYTSAQFSMDSLFHVLALQSSFRKRHGRDLDLSLQDVQLCPWLQRDTASTRECEKTCVKWCCCRLDEPEDSEED